MDTYSIVMTIAALWFAAGFVCLFVYANDGQGVDETDVAIFAVIGPVLPVIGGILALSSAIPILCRRAKEWFTGWRR